MGNDEPWARSSQLWQHAFFAASLGLTTLAAISNDERDVHAALFALASAAVLGAWYTYWFAWRRDVAPQHLAYLIGAAGIWAVMTALDPTMLMVGAVALAPYCLRHPFLTAGGIVVLGVVWLSRSYITDGGFDWPVVLACALGVLGVVAVSGYIGTLDREGRRRQRLLDELAAAQAELAATERWAGVLAERQRLARDIHDTLTQGFASIAMLLDAARADLPSGGPVAGRVEQAMRIARENLAESRRLVNALRPPQLDGTHLADAVHELTSRIVNGNGLDASTVVTGRPFALGSATEAELLRVIQEALTNAQRHANAKSITVTMSYLDDVVLVDVQDDGSGFDTRREYDGIGLSAMRERVAQVGGTLTIESTHDEGTTIAVSLPVAITEREREKTTSTADGATGPDGTLASQ
jgi:signal transduction histidine kinase